MKCKIIEIGPEDAFIDDIDRFRGAKGFFVRKVYGVYSNNWLQGYFTFDDPYQQTLNFLQIKVEPIPAI